MHKQNVKCKVHICNHCIMLKFATFSSSHSITWRRCGWLSLWPIHKQIANISPLNSMFQFPHSCPNHILEISHLISVQLCEMKWIDMRFANGRTDDLRTQHFGNAFRLVIIELLVISSQNFQRNIEVYLKRQTFILATFHVISKCAVSCLKMKSAVL